LFGELDSFLLEVNSSGSDPDEVFPGSVDLFVQVVSVGITIVSVVFVLLGNGVQVGNLLSEFLFLGFVDFVSRVLGIDVGLFQVGQKSED